MKIGMNAYNKSRMGQVSQKNLKESWFDLMQCKTYITCKHEEGKPDLK